MLTKDQEEAVRKMIRFLLGSEREYFLKGAGGSGKTYLLDYFITHGWDQYEHQLAILGLKNKLHAIYLAATTNKAVEALNSSLSLDALRKIDGIQTIYKYFKCRVYDDYSSGQSNLAIPDYVSPISNALIVVDECSMLPKRMLDLIRHHTPNCKIIYVGDSFQLAPVKEKPLWDNTPEQLTSVLSTPVRNKNQKALMDLCAQLRATVETLEFKPIQTVPGVIDLADDDMAKHWLLNADWATDRVLAYTNHKALKYIDFIEQHQHRHQNFLRTGQYYACNTACETSDGYFYSDEIIELTSLGRSTFINLGQYFLNVRQCTAHSIPTGRHRNVLVAADAMELKKTMNLLAKKKDWHHYFKLKNEVMDLRLPYASTIHKSQGSTFNEVFIDLGSFRVCKDPKTAARLLYVAVSRARNRIVFYGKLPKAYGAVL